MSMARKIHSARKRSSQARDLRVDDLVADGECECEGGGEGWGCFSGSGFAGGWSILRFIQGVGEIKING